MCELNRDSDGSLSSRYTGKYQTPSISKDSSDYTETTAQSSKNNDVII